MRPRLVIVSGPPAAGKTTLAKVIARELALPLISKDDIKEAIGDVMPAADREESRQLGRATYRVLYMLAERLIEAGSGLVLESNFARNQAETSLAPLVARARATLVQCDVPNELAIQRYRERARSGTRHNVHKDDIVLEAWNRGDRADHSALDLGIPVLHVDTSDGYRPSLAEVIAALRSA